MSAHSYPGCVADDAGLPFFTSDCAYGCGAWMGSTRSGAPDGTDPFGECPKAPKTATPDLSNDESVSLPCHRSDCSVLRGLVLDLREILAYEADAFDSDRCRDAVATIDEVINQASKEPT